MSLLLILAGADFEGAPPPPPSEYKHVLEVVRVAYLASSLPALFSDGELHEGTAPHGTGVPYLTIVEVSDTSTGSTTSGTATRVVEIQFSVHAAGAQEAKDLGVAIIAEFQRAALDDLADWSIPLCDASIGLLLVGRRKGPYGEDVHVQTVNFEAFLTRKVSNV